MSREARGWVGDEDIVCDLVEGGDGLVGEEGIGGYMCVCGMFWEELRWDCGWGCVGSWLIYSSWWKRRRVGYFLTIYMGWL